jgi:hypothetical protein
LPATFPFFDLPCELRDNIYHHVWTSSGYLHGYFQGRLLQLHYMYARYVLPDNVTHKVDWSDLEWLFTNKIIMHEALQQFSREAEWFMPLGVFESGKLSILPSSPDWTVNLPVDTSKLNRMTLCAANLSHFETPHRNEGHGYREELEKMAGKVREVGVRIERLRFMGHSYLWERDRCPDKPLTDKQIPNMAKNLKEVFKSAAIGSWQMGLVSPRNSKSWFLLDIEKDGSFEVLVDESEVCWS